MSESGLSCFISQLGDCIPWHVVCLQEGFKRLENLEMPGGPVVYTPSHHPQRGFRVPAVLVRADLGEDTEIYASGVRWVAVRVLSHAVLIISAHLPHARQSVMSYRETLQEITSCLERFKSAFPRHHVVLGTDCNVSLNGFEDGRFVGGATVPLTKVRSCADAERASALYEFMLNFGLRADNTWSEWDCVTRVGWRHESRESQVDYLFSSEETTVLDVWVDSSLVCDSDHLAVVGTYQTVRNDGVSGTGKKKRIPYALRWTANDPVAREKAVGGSGEFGADWRDPLAFLGFLARTADAHKTRQKCEKDQVICDLKAQLQCASTAVERRRCNCLLWRRRRALARQRRVVFAGNMRGETFSSATETWQCGPSRNCTDTEKDSRTVQYKLNAQSLSLFGLHRDVNDAHRASANRLQKQNKQLQLAESFWARTSVVGHQMFLR